MVEDQRYDRWGRALNPTFLIVRFEHGTTLKHKGPVWHCIEALKKLIWTANAMSNGYKVVSIIGI